MKRFTMGIVCLMACGLGPACQPIVGIEDRTEATGDAVDAGSDAACPPGATDCLEPDAEPPAGCPTGCLPPAPEGWTGPSATYDGAESGKPADCAGAGPYTVKEVEAHVGMTAEPATCTCGEAVPAARRCEADIVHWNNSACSSGSLLYGTASTAVACTMTGGSAGGYYSVDNVKLVAGTCTFPNATTTRPPRAFTKVELACGLPQPAACGGRADCTSAPTPGGAFARVCIHKNGDVACPSQDYANRFVAYKRTDDTRACTACAATPTGGSCGTAWTTANAAQCGAVFLPADKAAGTCYPYPGPVHVSIAGMQPSPPTCTPSGGAPTGTVTSSEPVTFCCNQ